MGTPEEFGIVLGMSRELRRFGGSLQALHLKKYLEPGILSP